MIKATCIFFKVDILKRKKTQAAYIYTHQAANLQDKRP